MKPKYRLNLLTMTVVVIVAAMLPSLFVTGCASSGTTLSTNGAYQSDTLLYQADQSAQAAYTTINAFLTWEQQNQTYLAKYPQIHTFAEKVRDEAKPAFQAAAQARANYRANRTSENAQAMNTTAAVLNALVDTATQILAQRQTP